MALSATQHISRPAASKQRWIICALLFWAFTANYIDRSVFSNVGPEMVTYLHLDAHVSDSEAVQFWSQISRNTDAQAYKELAATLPAQTVASGNVIADARALQTIKMAVARKSWSGQYWYIQVTFAFFFAISNMYLGRMVDVIGLRKGLAIACGLWALGASMQSIAPEIGALFGNPIVGFHICMALLSLGQGSIFPAAVKATAEWFPRRERALATGLFNSGANVGGLLVPVAIPALLLFLTSYSIAGHYIGWRGAFLPGVIIDLAWIATWMWFYRKPEDKAGVSEAELAIIHSDGENVNVSKVKVPWLKLLAYRQTWAVIGAKLLTDAYWSFYLFGAPDFFHRKFGLDPSHRKYLIMMIYIVSTVGSIAGGWISGKFMRMGWSLNKSRKVAMLICALMVAPVFYAALTSSQWLAAVLITLAASGHQAWMANTNNLSSDMFPKRVVGSVMGFAGCVSALGMMTVFFVTGKVLSVTGNYLPMFIVCSAAYLASVLIVHIAAPRLEQANIDVP
jgi:ACS family hexuronate transporter-like MFS transporter